MPAANTSQQQQPDGDAGRATRSEPRSRLFLFEGVPFEHALQDRSRSAAGPSRAASMQARDQRLPRTTMWPPCDSASLVTASPSPPTSSTAAAAAATGRDQRSSERTNPLAPAPDVARARAPTLRHDPRHERVPFCIRAPRIQRRQLGDAAPGAPSTRFRRRVPIIELPLLACASGATVCSNARSFRRACSRCTRTVLSASPSRFAMSACFHPSTSCIMSTSRCVSVNVPMAAESRSLSSERSAISSGDASRDCAVPSSSIFHRPHATLSA